MTFDRAGAIAFLRDAPWLHAARARAWALVLATATAVIILVWILLCRHGLDVEGKPLGTDFVSFWSASRLSLAGHAAAAYVPARHQAVESTLFPAAAGSGYVAFFYPPSFLLFCLPLALLPYFPALLAWLALGLLALLAALRRIFPNTLALAAFPALFVNLGHGQNGFLTAACFAWALVLAERRPFLAGAALGLLVIKPHLLLAAPIILIAARRGRMIVGAACSALLVIGCATAIFGLSTWRAFLADSALARATMENGLVPFWKMQSLFAGLRLLGFGIGTAYGAQLFLALAVLLLAGIAAARRPGAPTEMALLAAATPLCTPFLLDYDLCLLAVPLAWMAARGAQTGWQPWEKIVLLAAYVLPLVARPLAMITSLPLTPPILFLLLLCVLRRAQTPVGERAH